MVIEVHAARVTNSNPLAANISACRPSATVHAVNTIAYLLKSLNKRSESASCGWIYRSSECSVLCRHPSQNKGSNQLDIATYYDRYVIGLYTRELHLVIAYQNISLLRTLYLCFARASVGTCTLCCLSSSYWQRSSKALSSKSPSSVIEVTKDSMRSKDGKDVRATASASIEDIAAEV